MSKYTDIKKYTSSYNIKDFALNTIGPKYFPEDVLEGYNIGLLGYTLDLFANTTEDIFNTVPIVVNEMFPNLAEMPTSIYNYASLFQESKLMAEAAIMDCVLLLPLDTLIEYSDKSSDNTYREFRLDQRTTVYIEDKSFILDYDVLFTLRPYKGDYIITSSYIRDFNNSMNTIKNPYLRLQKVNYHGVKYVAIMVKMRRCEKKTYEKRVIDNDKLQSTIVQVEYEKQLANFEVYYRESSDSNYTQLQKKIINSKATDQPFCYYRLKDENTLEISFTNRENFFKPKFNSEIVVDYWETDGSAGNFEQYLGVNVEVYRNSDKYQSNSRVPIIAIPESSSTGGSDRLTIYELRDRVADAFATVDSYTTESDLQRHFNSFDVEKDTKVTFIKKRDDIFDRLFCAFALMKDKYGSYYKTNTLALKIYKEQFDHQFEQSGRYLLKPCNTFIYNGDSTRDMIKVLPDQIEEMETKPEFIYSNPFLMTLSNNGVIGYYLNNINEKILLDYEYVNNDSLIQFICNNLFVKRTILSSESKYTFTFNLTATDNDIENPILDANGLDTGRVKVLMTFHSSGGNEVAFVECKKIAFDVRNLTYTFEGSVTTDDYITLNENIRIYDLKSPANGNDIVSMIPMINLKVNIYAFFKYDEPTTTHKFSHIDGFANTVLTNTYTTEEQRVTLIQPLNMLKSRIVWEKDNDDVVYAKIYDVPVMKKIEKPTKENLEHFEKFIDLLNYQYDYMRNILYKKTNNYSVDMKFYNTYGRSNNFVIGENEEVINKVNCNIKLRVYAELKSEADKLIQDMKIFIKDYFEDINKENNEGIFISNLIQQLENTFSYLRYVVFESINGYDTLVQTIENNTMDINTLSKQDRIIFVPEYLNIEEDDIEITLINK